ncbi:MAG: tannase [Lachnospiraceae bacterium]|nr:tannase [Lachnospiraceae bacterium]
MTRLKTMPIRRAAAIMTACTLGLTMTACAVSTTENTTENTAESTGAENAVQEESAAEAETASEAEQTVMQTSLPGLDESAWLYNEEDDVYYQIGISYCETPADENYETLAVFVPGAYFTGTDNGDGTYTCEINEAGEANGYTALTAPVVMPINTPGYSAMAALTDYSSSVADYTQEGFVYVHAGCRGRDAGAPAGVTDLKAAARYLRYVDEECPGDAEKIFTFGMSGGGAQSALMGATGNSDLYTPYLEAIGAVEGASDAVYGAMCWCPITNLDEADEAYEWNLGVTRSGLSEEEQAISDALAKLYAGYINGAGFVDEKGNALTLEKSEEGIYQAGTYYDYIKGVIETSLEHFLTDTEFPYDASSSSSGGMGGPGGPGGMGGHGGHGGFGGGEGMRPEGEGGFLGGEGMEFAEGEGPGEAAGAETGSEAAESGEINYEEIDDITRNETSSGLELSGTYETAQDYIDALNANGEWVSYDAASGEVTITSVADFVKALKSASKNLGAFDQLDAGQGENTLFGYGDGEGAHFDQQLMQVLEQLGSEYAAAYAEDLAKTDSQGTDVTTRLLMYTPLYYLMEFYEGYGSSDVASYWRIRTGINQGDTALSTEVNLALALEQYEGVEDVDFETIWGQGHTQAERTGTSTENFIQWVNECMQES